MASKIAILSGLDRIAHRWRKGQAWIDREADEWDRHAAIQTASDDRLDAAVTKFVAASGSYALQGLLDLLRTGGAPMASGCRNCASGWVEVAIWRGHRVTEAAVACPSCRGGMALAELSDGWKRRDPRISDVVFAQDSDGRWRPLTKEEKGQ